MSTRLPADRSWKITGHRDIIVQPTRMFYMEQSYDLEQYINALSGIALKPHH